VVWSGTVGWITKMASDKKNLCHSSQKILFWKMLQKGGTANCHYDGGGVVVYINI